MTSERSDRALLVALAASINVGSIAFIVIAPFFPEIADDLGTTVPVVGQVAAARLLVGALFGLVVGQLADAYGHSRVMIVGLVAAAVTPLGIGLAPTYPVLLLTAIPGGLAAATLTGLTLAVAGSAFAGEARQRTIGLLSGIQAVTGLVGVPLLTAIGAFTGWRPVFVVGGLLALVAVFPISRPLPSNVVGRNSRRRPGVRAILAAYPPLLRHGPTVRIYAVAACRAVCWGAMVTYFGAYLKEEAGFAGGLVGLAYFLSSIGFFLACVAAGRMRRWPPRWRAAAGDCAMALVVGVLFVAPLATVPLLAVCAVSGASGAFGYVGISGLLAELAVERRVGAGITMSLGAALFSLGSAAGGVIGGVLIAAGGYGLLGLVAPVFGVAGAVMLMTPRRRRIVAPVAEMADA